MHRSALLIIAVALLTPAACSDDTSTGSVTPTSAASGDATPGSDATGTTPELQQGCSTDVTPPADVGALPDWFEQACAGAPWIERIASIEYVAGEVPDSGGFSNAVVITTDLAFPADQALGQQIWMALANAHITWAENVVVWYADHVNETVGQI